MKTIFAFLVIALSIALVVPAQAQTNLVSQPVQNGFVEYYTTLVVTTTGTTYSTPFSLAGYQGESMATYPLCIGYKVDSTAGHGSAQDTVNLLVYGSFDYGIASTATWDVVDTIAAAAPWIVLTRATPLDLNSRKYPWYRLGAVGLKAACYATVKLYVYPPRKDAYK